MKILFFYGNMQLLRCAYTKNTLIKDKEYGKSIGKPK